MTKRSVVKLLYSVSGALVALLVVLIALVVYLSALSARLPDLEANPDAFKTAETSIVYAADGSVLAEWYDEQDRTVVKNADIPLVMRQAAVAIEDRRFYEHEGVDPQGIMRALAVNAGAGEVQQGGSTITQQTVKQLFTGSKRTLSRKIEEALLALQLETRSNKDEVLGVYLNTVYFGRGAYGVESAAHRFFGVHANELTLVQAALLAGCIQSPTRFDPFGNPTAALERRNTVLAQMREQHYISAEAFAEASAEPLELAKPDADGKQIAPYFVEYVRRDLIQRLGSERLYEGGLRIYTTLEPSAQKSAEAAARSLLPKADDPEVAIASVRWSDGSIVALVGGRDFEKEHFDLATQGKRQTGSAFKPFVLAAALENGYTLNSRFEATPFSTPVRDGIWHVENYENRHAAKSMTLKAATIYSVNTVFARLIMRVGPKKVVDVAHRMGITTPIAPEPAIALGGLDRGVSPLEMASAFGTIANNGASIKPTAVAQVTDADGNMVYQPDRKRTQAITAKVARTLAKVLHEVCVNGTGVEADFGQWAAVKTGTAQSWRDAWIVGYSGDLSTAVWVGYPKAQIAMTNVHGIRVTGGSFPARIWRTYMQAATRRVTPVATAAAGDAAVDASASAGPGPGYSVYRVCAQSFKLARPDCPETMDLVFRVDSEMLKERCDLKH